MNGLTLMCTIFMFLNIYWSLDAEHTLQSLQSLARSMLSMTICKIFTSQLWQTHCCQVRMDQYNVQ